MTTQTEIIMRFFNGATPRFKNLVVKTQNDKVIIHTQTTQLMYDYYVNCDDIVLKYNGEIYSFIGANEYNLTDVDLIFAR